MGYDNVLKEIRKKEKADRKAALKKRVKEAAITRDEIYKLLPLREEEAVSLADLKSHFPEKSNDHISANVRSLFNNGRCKRTKRYDSEIHSSLTHCYYWKDTEVKEKSTPPIQGMYNPQEEEFSLRKDIFNEIPKNRNSAVSLNDMCRRRGLPSNNSGIASSLYFLYTLNSIKREKRGRLFYYWRDTDNKEYADIRGMGRKETNQSTRNFLLDVLPAHTSPVRISVRTLIIEGGGKYTKDAIESSLQKLLKNQKVVRGWDGKRFLYQHAGPNGNLKLEQIKTVPSSQPLIEESFNTHLSEPVIMLSGKKEKSLQEKIFDKIPISRKLAKTGSEIWIEVGGLPNNYNISSTLLRLSFKKHVKRERLGNVFLYWRDENNEEERGKEKAIKETLSAKEFIMASLPSNRELGLSIRDLFSRGDGKYAAGTIRIHIRRLYDKRLIKRAWNGKEFCYWLNKSEGGEVIEKKKSGVSFPSHGPENIVHIPSSPTEELLTKYKADNKKLDERIANIQKQIADLGQKQELQAEIQKREENETRLAELEEQLHKIAIADTSVKRGILH